jgi:ABC-type nitrate/sulfonate/bicarbonate transport system substrate-binding protein
MKTLDRKLVCRRIPLVVFFVILSAAGLLPAQENNPAEEPVLLRIGYLPVLSQLPLIVSYDRDRFSYKKVRIELTGFKSYISLEAAFRVKAIDIAYLPIPTIYGMKAEGIDILVGNSLHRGGSSLIMGAQEREKNGSATLYGIPGLMSSELFILDNSLSSGGLKNGDDFKIVAVQLERAIDELEQGHLDGLLLPEPYPTIASRQLAKKILPIQLITTEDIDTPQAALVFNRNIVINGNKGGLLEWLDSIEHACQFLEEDIQHYNGAQTILTQQQYFGFEPSLVRQAFSNLQLSLSFSSKNIAIPDLEGTLEKMIFLKLLHKSINVNDMLLDPHLLQ